MSRRAIILVLDGVGVGAAEDADEYGDAESHTLGHVARAVGGLKLPNLQRAGLGGVAKLEGMLPAVMPTGAFGLLEPRSCGKDSTTGHWEIAGLHLAAPFPTYPRGFPASIIDAFAKRTRRGVIGNMAGSGTEMLQRFGDEHVRTGSWIVYTSADSVFQIAAHEEVVMLGELYRACQTARELLVRPHDVSRVIARPFVGPSGAWTRTNNRIDWSLAPPGETLLDALAVAGIPRTSVGKVDDLFARRAIQGEHTAGNAEGIDKIAGWLASGSGLLFANLIDFDQLFGHRNDVQGFYRALREFDDALPALSAALREDDLLFITADHGNDPTTPSTDHARENVPLVALGPRVRPGAVGRRSTFSDLGATVADWFGISFRGAGQSFLPLVVGRAP